MAFNPKWTPKFVKEITDLAKRENISREAAAEKMGTNGNALWYYEKKFFGKHPKQPPRPKPNPKVDTPKYVDLPALPRPEPMIAIIMVKASQLSEVIARLK